MSLACRILKECLLGLSSMLNMTQLVGAFCAGSESVVMDPIHCVATVITDIITNATSMFGSVITHLTASRFSQFAVNASVLMISRQEK